MNFCVVNPSHPAVFVALLILSRQFPALCRRYSLYHLTPAVVFWLVFFYSMLPPVWVVRLDGWTPVGNRHSARLGSTCVFFYLEASNPIFLCDIKLSICITLIVGNTERLIMPIWENTSASLNLCLFPSSHLICRVFPGLLWLVLNLMDSLVLNTRCTASGPLVWGNLRWINLYITCKAMIKFHYARR